MLTLQINGQSRELDLAATATLADVLEALAIKPDRVAVEYNGTIVSRSAWSQTPVATDDRLEIVHFVGGGSPAGKAADFITPSALNAATIQNMCYRT